MFDLVRNNKKIVQGFLVLITLPFAFWGVESYVRNTDVDLEVATVGRSKISLQDFQTALRDQQERMRAQFGGRLDAAMLDTPLMRRALLDNLVNQRLLAQQAESTRLSVGDEELVRFIMGVPALQESGKFSKERYEALVAGQGMSKDMFEARLRQDMAMQKLLLPVTEASIAGRAGSDRWLAAQQEQRDISELSLTPGMYLAQVKLAPDAAQKYYEANRKQFESPQQVRAEYVVLSQDVLLTQAVVGEDEVKARYQARADSFKDNETRRASHILIRLNKDASKAEVDAAQAKAEDILAQLKKAPNEFARLAKQHSQDPGSAEKGGDLDWFGRNMMVKPFEEATFALKEGQLSNVVRSDFGFHIIRLTGVRAERHKTLDEVRGDILAELRKEWASKKYAEAVETFGNTVYEQADSLKPAADKWKLAVQRTDWMAHGDKTPARLPAPFDHAKLTTALFSDDAIKNRRNTEAIEVAPGTMVAARVLEHKPAVAPTLEMVKATIEQRLTNEEAAKLATKDGEEKLARLIKGETLELKWPAARAIGRTSPQGMSIESMREAFKADASKLPAYAGMAAGDGYKLYRIGGVGAGAALAAEQRAQMSQQYARLVAEEEFSAWMDALKEKYPVSINSKALENKER